MDKTLPYAVIIEWTNSNEIIRIRYAATRDLLLVMISDYDATVSFTIHRIGEEIVAVRNLPFSLAD